MAQQKTDAYLKAHTILTSMVNENGQVNYAKAKQQLKDFEAYQQLISELNVPTLSKAEKISTLINTYNLKVIEEVAKAYPISSVNDLTNFFEKKTLRWNGKSYSLNELENELRTIADARIHFALVCGAKSCPPLKNAAFSDKNLEDELYEITQKALAQPNIIFYDAEVNVLKVSPIFKWYIEDFTKTGTVGDYINNFKPSINKDAKIEYLPYDWSLNDAAANDETDFNLQAQAPSRNFTSGTIEVKTFWNLYTQTKGFDGNGSKVNYGNRSNYLTGLTSIVYGLNEKLNIGAEFWVSSANVGPTNTSVFSPYKFENNATARAALSYVGPKIRWQPFEQAKGITIQSTFLLPTGNDLDGDQNGGLFLAYDRFLWINQFMADKLLGNKWQIFGQFSTWASFFGNNSTFNTFVETPITGFLSYFPTQRLTLYVQQEFWPRWGGNGLDAFFRQEGFGFKYQIIPQKLEFESSATFFTSGKNQGAGNTLNFGFRLVK